MKTEDELKAKLRKIEALYSNGATHGEQDAAKEARKRIIDRLHAAAKEEKPIEVRISLSDGWSRQLFVALCRRYEIKPYRYARQRSTTVMLRSPKSFLDGVLWPEFKALNGALVEYLSSATEKIIREEIHANAKNATVVDEVMELVQA